jgi:uncharacterized membrane protein
MKNREAAPPEPMTTSDAEARARIRMFLEPLTLMFVALVMIANVLPRNWAFGVRTPETMASEAAWVAGNRAGGLVLLAACGVWVLAAIYLPRRFVKPVGVAAVLVSVAFLFFSQGWSF